ncbi:MAG: ribosomal protein S18-alanine N-acetyltransferase [Gammaproteobacteria bacterium]
MGLEAMRRTVAAWCSCAPWSATMSPRSVRIEQEAYAFPWSRGIFDDCLHAGHSAWVVEEGGVIHAYSIMAVAAGEAHCSTCACGRAVHGRGFGRVLLSQMLDLARARGAEMMFLEVRPSNARAVGLYHKAGFAEVGTRPGYYPAYDGKVGRGLPAGAYLITVCL